MVPQPSSGLQPRATQWRDLDGNGVIEAGERVDLGIINFNPPCHPGSLSFALDINRDPETSNWIVGAADNEQHCCIDIGVTARLEANRFGVTTLTPAGAPDDAVPMAHGVNDGAVVVGGTLDNCGGIPHPFPFLPIVWPDAESNPTLFLELDFPENEQVPGFPLWYFTNGLAIDVNEDEAIVGFLRMTSGQNVFYRAVRWLTPGSLSEDLGTLVTGDPTQPPQSQAWDINVDGDIVGWTDFGVDDDTVRRAFVWSGGVMSSLGVPANGFRDSEAYGMNDGGDVVGRFELTELDQRAFVSADGELVDLNLLVDNLGDWTLEQAWDVNNDGWIVGLGTPEATGSALHGYLLRPQDECSACVTSPCPADFNGDGRVASADLLEFLTMWGPCPGCPADFDGDGVVGSSDLLTMLAAYGPCNDQILNPTPVEDTPETNGVYPLYFFQALHSGAGVPVSCLQDAAGINDVWFCYRAPQDGVLSVEPCFDGGPGPHTVAIYEYGDCDGVGAEVACGICNGSGAVDAPVVEGRYYRIRVFDDNETSGDEGVIRFSQRCESSPWLEAGSAVCGDLDLAGVPGEDYPVCDSIEIDGLDTQFYSVFGDGTELTASTCNPPTTDPCSPGTVFYPFARVRVFCGPCSSPTCVDETVIDCVQTGEVGSEVTWCSEPGRTYLVAVYDELPIGTGPRPYRLSIASSGTGCRGPDTDCSSP